MQTNSNKILSLYQEHDNGHLKDYFSAESYTHT